MFYMKSKEEQEKIVEETRKELLEYIDEIFTKFSVGILRIRYYAEKVKERGSNGIYNKRLT